MESYLNPNVKKIAISGIRQFFNKVARHPDAISLSLGLPDLHTPLAIKDAGKKAICENRTTYTPNAGILELRRAVAGYMKRKYSLDYHENEIIVTTGASEAIDITLRTLLTNGDEVMLPAPVYPGYEPVIRMCGATPVFVDTKRTGFKLTRALIETYLNERTKCIILPYPSNPTGAVLDHDELQDIADFLQNKNVFVVADEIYSELTYDSRHVSIATFPGMRKKTIVINGLSKSHAMTGWRIGFLLADENIARHLLKVHQYNVTCASTISQYAALEAVTNAEDEPANMRRLYRKRRDFAYQSLLNSGLEVTKPQGAFYLFPSITSSGLDSFSFAEKLLEEKKVAVVPGSAFSSYGEGYIRLSYACEERLLKEGLQRLSSFLESLRQD